MIKSLETRLAVGSSRASTALACRMECSALVVVLLLHQCLVKHQIRVKLRTGTSTHNRRDQTAQAPTRRPSASTNKNREAFLNFRMLPVWPPTVRRRGQAPCSPQAAVKHR